MLPTKNRTISVSRLTDSGEKRIFVELFEGVRVYINQSTEEIGTGFQGDPAFYASRMMTDGNHATIDIGDRVTDDLGHVFDVRGKSVHASLVGSHHQYLLTEAIP